MSTKSEDFEYRVRSVIADIVSERLATLPERGPATNALLHVGGDIFRALDSAGFLTDERERNDQG